MGERICERVCERMYESVCERECIDRRLMRSCTRGGRVGRLG